MLKRLVIRDLAVVSALELPFAPGMTAISGETGAGKSLLLDGLLLAAGARADAALVRSGAERAEVEAEFDLAGSEEARAWLREQELDEGDGLLLRRVLRADGGSRAFVNGRGVSLAQLRALASLLVEVHGQHEHQRLLDREHQLDLLDGFGGIDRSAVAAAAEAWRRCRAECAALASAETDPAVLADKRDRLREFEALKLTAGTIDELDAEQRRLAHGQQLLGVIQAALDELHGEGGRRGLLRALLQQAQALDRLQAAEPRLAGLARRFEAAELELADCGRELAVLAEAIDLDPARLAAVEDRLSAIHELARRHRCLAAGLPELASRWREELAVAESLESRLAAAKAAEMTAAERYRLVALALRSARQDAAKALEERVEALLGELAMAGGRFRVDFEALPEGPRAAGMDQIEFLVSANPGMPPRPLRKVASGGELARISLAIKVATLDQLDTPVLVFDEVDSGVGGATAARVGQKLRALGRRRQVLCVTHLPQVAACAHQQVRVSKAFAEGRPGTLVELLPESARVDELARMLGGLEVSEATRVGARDLLASVAD